MVSDVKPATPDGPRSPWPGVTKFVFIVLLAVMLYLLVRSMVIHHFFSGGQMK